jgi:hypothetical protein
MRRRVALAAGAVVLVVVAYVGFRIVSGGDSAAADKTVKENCPDVRAPKASLAIRPSTEPIGNELDCDIREYTNFVGPPSWTDMAHAVTSAGAGDHAWQQRILLWGYPACTGCIDPVLDMKNVEHDHPDWILRNTAGQPVHPLSHPGWVLYDFGNVNFQTAWANAMVADLQSDGGWSGIDIADAGNDPDWTSEPIDPRTGKVMTDSDRIRYLAQALTLVTNVMHISGYNLIAQNGPPSIIEGDQIGSTDGVSVGDGFVGREGATWVELFDYFQEAVQRYVGAWVWDDQSRLTRDQAVFGLASYLLVSGPLSTYGVHYDEANPIYQIDPGTADAPATVTDGVYVRQFADATVAVNPGPTRQTVQLPTVGKVTIEPGEALIDTPKHLYTNL